MVLATGICQRAIFSESSNGATVQELEPKDKASNEIRLMAIDVLRLMGVGQW